MGMAASQARLLSITARIHDVEYEAQSIQNAKIQLATQSDAAYAEYNQALDATTLTLAAIDGGGNTSTIAATFNNLVSSKKLSAADGTQYALTYNGKLIVEDEVYKAYNKFKTSGSEQTGHGFAMYMLGMSDGKTPSTTEIRQAEKSVFEGHYNKNDIANSSLKAIYDKLLEMTGGSGYDSIFDDSKVDNKNKDSYKNNLKTFQNLLYQSYKNEIYNKLGSTGVGEQEEIDAEQYNYYVSIYNQIQQCGGACMPISDFNGGESGDAANNSEWLQAMVKCGKISLTRVTTDKNTGDVTMEGASPSSEASLGYTNTTTIDKTALAKAEAKYEHAMKEIDRKDKQYDMTLSKLETERSALTTEYDSVKKVIEDNIERTFGIFS